MPLLKIYQGQALQTALSEIVAPVQVNYTALDQPEPDLLAALADLKALTPHVLIRVSQDSTLEVDRLVVQGQTGRPLVFVGAPLGLELAALVSAIVVAGRGDSGLAPKTRQALAGLSSPVHLEIFTTPTCPQCAQVVSLVHKFAFESAHIVAEAISAVVMIELAQHYRVLSTPHLVLNKLHHLKGRLREEQLLKGIKEVFSQ